MEVYALREDNLFDVKKDPAACKTPGCENDRIRNGRYSEKLCYKCKSREHRARHPVTYAWRMLKKSAKRRKIPFTMSLEWFKEFCSGNSYMEGKGRTKDCLSIDRIKPELGYAEGNLQVLTKSENSKKWHEQEKAMRELAKADALYFADGDPLPF